MDPSEIPVPGVEGLEHTADVGFRIEGSDLAELFRRGALGAMWMVLERPPVQGNRGGDTHPETRPLELVEEDLPALFRSWLRALLFWEETEGFVTRDAVLSFAPAPLCGSPDGQAFGLSARVHGVVDLGPRVREIKGVTFHGLAVERIDEVWRGRVILDV